MRQTAQMQKKDRECCCWIHLTQQIRRGWHLKSEGFIRGIYEIEEREESVHFIKKIRLEFPKVPQQNGEECGIYVLYFIHCFLQNGKLAQVLENKTLEEDFSQLFDDGTFDPEELENFRKDVHAFQVERSTETGQ
uniref:Ubiquitin-like protease family profile domain-containing protein n=1 Tax=Aegilops tauschii subsp. strangulata TaxID=200361 RepID=A0A453HKS8_AEGTS